MISPRSAAGARVCVVLALLSVSGCGSPELEQTGEVGESDHPSILLVTLDTTRADATGLENGTVPTPNLVGLAERGVWMPNAYATAPTTLPSHTSMMSGLYPSVHGLHENARTLAPDVELLAEKLRDAGYRTAAFVSATPLEGRFGLARGFDLYQDDFEGPERSGVETAQLVLEWLDQDADPDRPWFIWVHFFDAHDPYEPPAEFQTAAGDDPYLGEIAYVDRQLGRVVESFEATFVAHHRFIVIAGDHGEGRGDHGEALHGNLAYDSVIRVPLVVVEAGGDSKEPRDGVEVLERAVSLRHFHDTALGWAGIATPGERTGWFDSDGVVLTEAMKPYLHYGWLPQVAGISQGMKLIRSGVGEKSSIYELFDLKDDPGELENLWPDERPTEVLRSAVDSYPLPANTSAIGSEVDAATRNELSALGYVAWDGEVRLQPDAPAPKDRTELFADLDLASRLFARGEHKAAIPVFERLLLRDPGNLMVNLRLAVARSLQGQKKAAEATFERASELAPDSLDVMNSRALHHLRFGEPEIAEPLLKAVLGGNPDRVSALDGMAEALLQRGRLDEAAPHLERLAALTGDPAAYCRLGEIQMMRGQTAPSILAFEQCRDSSMENFRFGLELGVLYLAEGRLEEARVSLDAADSQRGGKKDPMLLFKRAQVSVLLDEPDALSRVRAAWRGADDTTRALIERERLFQGLDFQP